MEYKDGSKKYYGASEGTNGEGGPPHHNIYEIALAELYNREPSIDYVQTCIVNKRFTWGWLGKSIPKGLFYKSEWKENESDLKERVTKALTDINDKYLAESHYFGCHQCEICSENQTEMSGALYIAYKDLTFYSPFEVVHYIKDHNYKPPKKAIEAILHGKRLTDEDFIANTLKKHKGDIAKEVEGLKAEMAKTLVKNKISKVRRKEWESSLNPSQRSVLKRWQEGTMQFIGVNNDK